MRFGALTLALLFLGGALPASAAGETSFERARLLAEREGIPVLLKIGVDWQASSRLFDEAVRGEDTIRKALEGKVVLCTVNAEEEGGSDLGSRYDVRNYPTFLVTDRFGETIDRWYGFGCRECFIKRLASAVAEPITVNDRIERFRESPDEIDAKKLGEVRHNQGMFAEAAAWYRRAYDLNRETETNYEALVFHSMAYGNYYNLWDAAEVRDQADRVCSANSCSDLDLMKVASSMYKVANRAGDLSLALPYLKAGVEKTSGSENEQVRDRRAKLLPAYALHILHDRELAVRYKKEIQRDGWLADANRLNDFAWWCYESGVNLEEAGELARKAVRLAAPGKEKANVLDTLAEICSVTGECGEAVEYMRMAVAEDPGNEYLREKLGHFEEMVTAEN